MANLLRAFREAAGLKQARLADLADTSQPQINRLELSRRKLSKEWAERLAPHLGIDAARLMFGPGPVSKDSEEAPAGPAEVPLLSWISAGSMMREDVSDEALGTITVTDLPPGDWIALKVVGDSMDRISPPESIIFVDRRDRKLIPNGLYVIADEEGNATYKRYRPGPPPRFEAVSMNQAHEPIFPAQEPLIVGRVKRSMIDT